MKKISLTSCTFFWLIIFNLGLFAQERGFVTSSFPSNGADNLPCNTFISFTLHFPSESKQLDPATLDENSLKMFEVDFPDRKIKYDINYDVLNQYVQLIPKSLLNSETTYAVELSVSLVDDRGFSLKPFRMEFVTGICHREDAVPEIAERGSEEEEKSGIDINDLDAPYIDLSHFKAFVVADSVEIAWQTQLEFMFSDFTVDRSQNRKDFQILDRVPTIGDGQEERNYFWVDHEPEYGWNYYRLSLLDILGEVQQSDTVGVFYRLVEFGKTKLQQADTLEMNFVLAEKTTMAFMMKSSEGEIVRRKAGFIYPGSQKLQIPIGDLKPGTYFAVLRTPDIVRAERVYVLP
ncbi:MAG: Ig-like domain-containing protein [Bacteroidia bacterium]|nr:Ig-like domain-containing protein [Bacteroidia bacterium]